MATVYKPPAGFEAPDFMDSFVNGRFDPDLHLKITDDYTARLATEARRLHAGDLVGEIVGFPVADGYALYMVWNHKPLQLVHIDINDGWQIPEAHARGLRLSDVRQIIESERRMRALLQKGRP